MEGSAMPKITACTFTKKIFHYDGNLNSYLDIYTVNDNGIETGTKVRVDNDTILFIRNTIKQRGEIKMGACRDNPSSGSLGELLIRKGKSPQYLSYVLPLLEEAGIIKHFKTGNAYWVKSIDAM